MDCQLVFWPLSMDPRIIDKFYTLTISMKVSWRLQLYSRIGIHLDIYFKSKEWKLFHKSYEDNLANPEYFEERILQISREIIIKPK